ncbi:MAG: TIGR01458 family HAD-type hydrolase [Pseudomonadota bacterium]|nr:TIGR01458 family HAD-type hydrolase [Pseudomonadota bacterium]
MNTTHPIKGLALDMDGVLHVGNQAMPGAAATLRVLRERGMPFRFITNTSTRSPDELQRAMATLGLDVSADEIFSAVTATCRYLEQSGRPRCHLLVADSVKHCFAQFPPDDREPEFVVIGDIGERWHYAMLNEIFGMLMRGAKLVCMHRNRFWQTEHGLKMDIGAFVAGLEYASGKQAVVIGKPSWDFFRLTVQALGLTAGEVAIVGDDIDTDIGGGQAAGLRGILVKTGKYREELVQQSSVQPDHVIASIADLPGLLAD